MKTFMKIFNVLIILINALATVIFSTLSVYCISKSTPNYDEACYDMLIAIFSFLMCTKLCEND